MAEGKQTLTTKCFDMLTESILSGKILPGERLLSEDLKRQYGVGMSPIREALSKLAATGLVKFEEHKGFSVAKMTVAEVIDDIHTFLEIETLCLKQSIDHGDDEWEGRIIAALHSLSKIETAQGIDYLSWTPFNIRFHNALISGCPLRSLMEIRNHLYQRHQWYILLSYKFVDEALFHANHVEHQQLAQVVLARNKKAALEQLSFHITAGINDLISKLLAQGLIDESA